MSSFDSVQAILAKHKQTLELEYQVTKIGIFGSVARGEQQLESDIDMLVEFSEVPDFFQFLRLEEYLESLLGSKVDLVRPNALRPELRQQILSEVIYL